MPKSEIVRVPYPNKQKNDAESEIVRVLDERQNTGVPSTYRRVHGPWLVLTAGKGSRR